MNMPARIAICVALAAIFGGGKMLLDKKNNAEWVVSPQEIAEARAAGKMGVSRRPGTVTVLPIRSEKADLLPFIWAFYGLGGAFGGFVLTRPRKKPPAA